LVLIASPLILGPVPQLTRVQAELKVCQQEREKASVAFRACEQAKALMDIELKVLFWVG
jgi:hypothetical protein